MTAEQPEPWPSGGASQPAPETGRYLLRLFVAGMSPASTAAVARLKAVCEEHLAGRYELEVVDIYQQPELAAKAQIVAVPALVRELPAPLRKLIGNFSDTDRLLVGLGLERRDA